MALDELGQAVDAVDGHLALPRQVVQADMLELHAFGRHVEQRGEVPLKADRHVAQADGPVAVVEQRLGDEAGRVGEVQQPGAGRAQTPRVGGDV